MHVDGCAVVLQQLDTAQGGDGVSCGAGIPLVEEQANAGECSFCGRKGENTAVDTDTVLERIGRSSLSNGQGQRTSSTNEDFEAFVLEAFGETQYTPAGVYAMTQGEALRAGWDDLVETVKHRQRFFFVLARNDRSGDGAGVAVPRGRDTAQRV